MISSQYLRYVNIAYYTVKVINEQYFPPGLNFTALLQITYVHRYVKVEFDYRFQMTLVQTNCSNPSGHAVCLPQPYTSTELVDATLYTPLCQHHREISLPNQVVSVFLPWYGIYVTQEELKSLSNVVEKHLKASSKAMIAEHKALQEVKTVALQNCMALDLLGQTCKVIGAECCSYISNTSAEVLDTVHDTATVIKELHINHGFD